MKRWIIIGSIILVIALLFWAPWTALLNSNPSCAQAKWAPFGRVVHNCDWDESVYVPFWVKY